MSDKLKNIRSWLNKNGYPLEMKVAKILKEKGFEIGQSILYKDNETGKYRETDIIAHITKNINNVWFNLTFVFECKKTIEKPWVAFINKTEEKNLTNTPPIFGSRNAQLLFQQIIKNNNYRSPTIFPDLKKYAYNLVSSHNENKDLAYNAMQSVLKATDYLVTKSNESNKMFCNIYIPIIVIEGSLIEASLDQNNEIELCEINKSYVITTKSFEEQSSSLLMVITSEFMEDFSSQIFDDCHVFFDKYSKELDLISKNHPKNYSGPHLI